MDLPSTRGLQALAALRSAVSLSRAAERLGVTRSALSHRIAELERQLGVDLVRRAGRGLALTDDALSLLAAMGDALDRIESAVAPLRHRQGQLRVSTVSTFASLWLIPRLPDWQRRYPQTELSVSSTTRVVDLDREDLDCAIRHGLGRWPGLTATRLFDESLVPVARPDVAGLSPGSTLVRARSRFLDWPRWWRAVGRTGEPPTRSIVVENRAQAMEAALAGVGIVAMDEAYAAPHLAAGRLRRMGSRVKLDEAYILVASEARPHRSQAVQSFRGWLLSQCPAS